MAHLGEQIDVMTAELAASPRSPTARDYPVALEIAKCVQGERCDSGFVELSAEQLIDLGIEPSRLRTTNTGFKATIFGNQNGQYAVAMPGATITLEDLPTVIVGVNHETAQAAQAAVLVAQLVDRVGVGNVTVIGYSLGGRNAALASVATGATAITFNAMGPSDGDLGYAVALGRARGIADPAQAATANSSADSSVEAAQIINHFTLRDPVSCAQAATRLPAPLGLPVAHSDVGAGRSAFHGLDSFDPTDPGIAGQHPASIRNMLNTALSQAKKAANRTLNSKSPTVRR